MTMNKMYRRRGIIHARPYVPGESLKGVFVSFRHEPTLGGMIATGPLNPNEPYYIIKELFDAIYEPV